MRILIFGNGQIGNFYLEHYQTMDHHSAKIARIDITDETAVQSAIDEFAPDVVINTAAATNLEWCGDNRLAAFNVNVLGAANVAAACDRVDAFLVHYSSGCVFSSFDGTDAKSEDSTPNPASYYGWTKVWSEQAVAFERSERFRLLILRPRQPVSAQANPKNMLFKMLTFAKFVDTANSGTVIEDLMMWTDELVRQEVTGVVHVANSGYTTPYTIGSMIAKSILPGLAPEKIEKAELDRLTPNARVDTVLDVTKLESLGVDVVPYERRLPEIIEGLAENLRSSDRKTLRVALEKTAEASRQRTVLNHVFPSLYGASTGLGA